ncbi:class I SAM-dependent methyltransferase [Paenibacillus sp. 1001270B_150601_E10]|uniref:class I SAM-dependent methyltransferase n=1 Tax=Paenibacillus sp. 1001270B_150601_E10 TaxID=2787079 RepID=UPI00189CB65C|nr:class I SAM-dependent methyltransferase [Paenibacillus sp. 1001270B_150601_E10]
MSFYKDLTPYYDDIFPANQKQIQFIQSYMKESDHLLDVGAGTGNAAEALVERGFHVTAIEPEPSMFARLEEKASNQERLSALPLTMQQCDQLKETYDGIYCVGNTLVHLDNREEVQDWLKEMRRLLREDGTLIIQIVNIEKIQERDAFHFPSLAKNNFTFDRAYDLTGDKILFTTTITSGDNKFSNTIPLLKLTYQELEALIREAGFQTLEAFSSFEKAPYDANGAALILAAR